MKTIYKYKLQVVDVQLIEIPLNAKIICVQVQFGELCIWVECNPENSKGVVEIEIFGTGNPISDFAEREYIGTVQHGAFVWHVYQRTN